MLRGQGGLGTSNMLGGAVQAGLDPGRKAAPALYRAWPHPLPSACPSLLYPLLAQELEGLGRSDLLAYLPVFLGSLHVEALVHGNITATQALELGRGGAQALQGDGGWGLAADARPLDRCMQLPKPCSLLHRQVETDQTCCLVQLVAHDS